MKTKKSVLYFSVLLIAIVILINILSDRFSLRFDLTGDHRYTLSRATKDILRQLDEPVTITAYFSENMPPEIARARRDFKEMLIEYANLSKGKVVYEFIDPNKSPENEQKAMEAGIQPVIINTRDKDQSVQKKAYLGAVIQKGEQTDVQPFIQPGAAMEYALSSGIKKLSVMNKPKIAFIVGHGEPTLDAYAQVMNSLVVLYAPIPVVLNDTAYNLEEYQTAVLIAPKDSIPAQHFAWLDRFLNEGKRLVVAVNRVDGDMTNAMGKDVTTGLESWLERWGLRVENNFLIDASCAPVMVTQQQGVYTISTNVKFPYIPVISTFADHPITKGLEAVVLPFASTITFTGDSSWIFTPILESSAKSGTRPSPTYFDIREQWTEEKFPLANLVAGAVLEMKSPGSPRMVIFSDGDFPVNGSGQEAHQIQPDNASLLVNAIDWLSDDTGLIALRTKGVLARPLDQIDDSKKSVLKFLNFFLPILLIIGFGMYRIQFNRSLRIKRMEDSYV